MRAHRRTLAIAAAIAAILSCGSEATRADTAIACVDRKADDPPRTVTEIIDGDTLGLDDGSEVRLIGALQPKRPLNFAPRSSWPPEKQAVAALTDIAFGRTVEVISAGRAADRYGRRLAHVFVLDGEGNRVWVQGALLERGHARAYALRGSADCLAEMFERETTARSARLGLWAHGAYTVRRASRPSDLMKARSTFQIVEGRVVSVASVRGAIYLNFGSDWRRDFTAAFPRRGKPSDSGVEQFDAAAFKGKTVRVRGWIERRNGPFIELVDLRQIEIVDEPTAAAPLAASISAPSAEASGPNEKRPASLPGASEP